jgi:putative transcriptional regulator
MSRSPRHHPSEDLLLRYAAGTAAPVPSLMVSTHLPFCARCRAAVRLGEDIGGVLLADSPPEPLAPEALTRVLARLDAGGATSGIASAARDASLVEIAPGLALPAPLRDLIEPRPRWRWLAPGISRLRLNVPGAAVEERVYLLRVAPRTRLPEHTHNGWEATCVLAGHFTDVTGEYGPGDVAEIDEQVVHQPMSGPDEGCICLIACHGKLRLSGTLARLIQPLLGI